MSGLLANGSSAAEIAERSRALGGAEGGEFELNVP